MATVPLGTVVRHIRSLTLDATTGEHTDAVLLGAFLRHNDPTAFEALVRRHGPMILRVCQRTLGDRHSAEDALQATFLVLARQAAAIRKTASLSSWLYGVAYRTALRARKAAFRRHKHEANAPSPRPSDPALSAAWRELAALLDAEIQLLPEVLRTTFIACCLENRTRAETASLLGIRESAVAMRLSRARQRLQQRLARRGVSLTAVLAAAALGASDAVALPAPLATRVALAAARIATNSAMHGELISTTALQLAEGVLKTMFLTKLKMATTVILLAGLAIAGVVALGLQALTQTAEAAPQAFEISSTAVVPAVNFVSSQSEEEPAITYVDLQPKANQKLKETMKEASFPDNHLGDLKQGKQTLEGFKFNIGEGLIYLANEKLKEKLPEKVEGIKIAAKFAQLHILHATAYRDNPETVIAKYIVRYDDKTNETIDVVYGQDVLDWWNYPGTTAPGRGKVVWKGANEAAKGFEATLWLFAHTWKNPHPNKQVASIDFVSTLTEAAPFVVAMTLEGPTKDAGVGKDGVRFLRAGKYVQSLAYCNEGKNMVAVLWDGTPRAETQAGAVVLWDVGKGQLDQTLERFEKDLQYWSVRASRNGKIVAASATHVEKDEYGAIRVWDAATGKVLRTFEFPAQVQGALALSPDGKKVAGGDCKTATAEVCVWDVQSAELLKKLQAPGLQYFAVALSDDGKWIAGGGRMRGGRGKVVVWDLENGKVKHEWIDDFMLTIAALEFSPDGKLLAGGGPNTATRVWDMETGKVKHVLKDHEAVKLAFSPDGQTLAIGDADHRVVLWDVAKEKTRVLFEASTTGDRKQVIAHVFSPDGRTLAAGHADGMIRFWPVPR
jgi:RNA polymerase sigma factor (sigma-70 family)